VLVALAKANAGLMSSVVEVESFEGAGADESLERVGNAYAVFIASAQPRPGFLPFTLRQRHLTPRGSSLRFGDTLTMRCANSLR